MKLATTRSSFIAGMSIQERKSNLIYLLQEGGKNAI
jgi:hypothetical protein